MTLCGLFFFFQAEDGIRDIGVTGVQTCALPICTLDMELWGKDEHLRGIVSPVFYNKSGEQIAAPDQFHDAILRVTAAVCCCGCRHTHLLNSVGLVAGWR